MPGPGLKTDGRDSRRLVPIVIFGASFPKFEERNANLPANLLRVVYPARHVWGPRPPTGFFRSVPGLVRARRGDAASIGSEGITGIGGAVSSIQFCKIPVTEDDRGYDAVKDIKSSNGLSENLAGLSRGYLDLFNVSFC